MKKHPVTIWVGCGTFCLAAMLLSVWHSVTFNDSRLVAPMDFGSYVFRPKDLPMILSVSFTCVYIGSLSLVLLLRAWRWRKASAGADTVRRIDPRLGALGLLGFLGFTGFWTYSSSGVVAPFAFFLFFGFFAFFYEGKMSGTFMDERFRENAARAQLAAYKTTFGLTLTALAVLCQGKLFGSLEHTLIAAIVVLSLTLALGMFLPGYLLYRYDHDDRTDEGEG